MTSLQSTALQWPCTCDEQQARPFHARWYRHGPLIVTVVLTVDLDPRGGGDPDRPAGWLPPEFAWVGGCWHAAAALRRVVWTGRRADVAGSGYFPNAIFPAAEPVAGWTAPERETVRHTIDLALEGVGPGAGAGLEHWERADSSVHRWIGLHGHERDVLLALPGNAQPHAIGGHRR